MSCAPNQPPMPSPLPGEIPDTAISTARIKACPNGHEVPPADSCAVSLGDMMVELQKYMHCTLNAFEISQNQGSCGVLRVVKGAVEITGMSVLIDECLSCLEPKKICPGKDGDVLTTVGSSVVWKPAVGGAATVDCKSVMALLEKDAGCVEAGSGVKYVLGYDAATDKVKYFPAPGGSSFIGNCTDLQTKMQTECFTQKAGAPEKMFGTVGGIAGWYPYSAPVAGAAAFIGDCAALKDKLGTCVTEGTGAPTKVLAKGPNGIEWLNPPAGGGGGGATTCAEMPALLKCPPDAAAGEEAARVLAYAGDGTAKKYALVKPYHGEVRAAGDPPVGTAGGNAGGVKLQDLPKTFGTLNDIIGLWAGGTYNFSGDAATFDAGTGRYKILKTGRYQVSLGVFLRVNMTGGATLLANAYAGITVKRPVTSYNGGTYRADSAIYRVGQQNFYADGKNWDSTFQGSVTLALEAGSELWARAVMANTSSGITIATAAVRDDPAAHFTLSQLDDAIFSMPGA
jgi:hypothetical protein